MSQQERATILLIDDHPMLRTGVKQLISMAPDIQVIGEASNGAQGIELAESLDPDLILLDLNMPGMNGLETLDKLREKSLSGRVVVPGQITVVILQRHEPAPFTAGEFPLFIDQQVDIGVAPRREPTLQLMTHFIADFTDGKQLRLFTRRQTIVAHAGLAKLLRHFGKVPGVVINLGSNPHIGQRILRLRRAGGVAGGQRPDGNARQQQEKGQRWQQTERHRH